MLWHTHETSCSMTSTVCAGHAQDQERRTEHVVNAQAVNTLPCRQTTWLPWTWTPWTSMQGCKTPQANPTCSGTATSPQTMLPPATWAASRAAAIPAAGVAAGVASDRALHLPRLHPSCPCLRGRQHLHRHLLAAVWAEALQAAVPILPSPARCGPAPQKPHAVCVSQCARSQHAQVLTPQRWWLAE